METIIHDIRYGLRTMRKTPGFTAVAVIALALGIGANTAIFSVVNALLLKPLPYKDAERLVLIWHTYPKLKLDQASVSAPSYVEYRDMTRSFDGVATATEWSVNLTGAGEPERLQGARVSYNLFSTLGVLPVAGRSFLSEEDQPGKNRVVVLSYGLWQRRFGGDPGLVGRTIMLDGNSYDVVGIMPKGFVFMIEVDLFTPIAFTPEQLAANNHGNEYLICVARMKPGVSFAGAAAEMNSVADELRPQFYGPNWGITVIPLREQLIGSFRTALYILLAAVGCVLLIACANVANLLLARASARHKEIAVRTALGACRSRIVRQLLTESVLLAALGGALGLLLAFLGIRLLVLGVPEDITGFIVGWKDISISTPVLGFTFGVSMLTGIVFGLVPALHASKPDLNESLKEGGRGGTEGRQRNLIRSSLVVAEVAIAMVLLVGAGLLIRSFMRLQQVSPGFNPANVLTMQLSLPRSKYADKPQIATFFDQLVQRVSTLPGVQSAAVGTNLPMANDGWNASFAVENLQVGPDEPSPHGDPHRISPDYFAAMGIPLLRGRFFTNADSKDSLPVAIVDQTLAEQYWPDQDPIGKRIAAFFEGPSSQPHWREIVGVVGHVKQYGLDGKSKVQYYFPQTQSTQNSMYLVLRTASDPKAMVAAIREALDSIDKDQPIYKVTTLEQMVANSTSQKRFSMFLLGVFAAVALLLAAVGIYGVMSYAVTQRTHEVGIRMALGAQQRDVLALVVRQGMLMAVIGVGIGLIGAFAATQVMASLLFGVGTHDPLTFAGISLLLGTVALIASFIPARRATRVDPMIALRYE
ncbi:MAG TPA: ABC transporter permease [Blastocatellia bacterium]|nr:ABC transporter permease [Blastocatellia bacterium]